MADHLANLGSVTAQETLVDAGRGPHVFRMYPVQAGLATLAAGLLVALDRLGQLVPFDAAQEAAASGDGAAKTFTFALGGPVVPGSITVGDGTEAFSDDGFGTLTGDAGGSGTVNYATGAVSATFNAAPAEATSNIECGYKPQVRGVLRRECLEGAVTAEVIVMGQVVTSALTVGVDAPAAASSAQLLDLDRSNIWPIGQ